MTAAVSSVAPLISLARSPGTAQQCNQSSNGISVDFANSAGREQQRAVMQLILRSIDANSHSNLPISIEKTAKNRVPGVHPRPGSSAIPANNLQERRFQHRIADETAAASFCLDHWPERLSENSLTLQPYTRHFDH